MPGFPRLLPSTGDLIPVQGLGEKPPELMGMYTQAERRRQFDNVLPALALQASKYFGTDSKGLVYDEVPLGHVDIGRVKSLGPLPEK
jgi:hypothetical protein